MSPPKKIEKVLTKGTSSPRLIKSPTPKKDEKEKKREE